MPDSRRLAAFEEETSHQIVVATFPSLEGGTLEDISIRLADAWKIGQKGRDNGVIVLIFARDRLARIEVGYGLESVIPDAFASQVIEQRLKPAFRRGDYGPGLFSAVEALQAASRRAGAPRTPASEGADSRQKGFSWLWLLLLLFLFLPFRSRRRRWSLWPFLAGMTLGGMGRRPRGWGGGWGGFGGGGGRFGGGGASGRW